MNPLEETQEITVNDMVGFTEKCTAAEVDEGIEEFLDLKYLSARKTSVALCSVAVEIMKDLTGNTSFENEKDLEQTPGHRKKEENDLEKIQGIDLSESCLNDEQKQTFRSILLRNRQRLVFSKKELGLCEIAPMKIKVDESQAIVSWRLNRYSPQKMDIIDEQVRQLIDIGVMEPCESAWHSLLVVVQKKNGKPRLYTDFRMLNMITFKDKFPIATARLFFFPLYGIQEANNMVSA